MTAVELTKKYIDRMNANDVEGITNCFAEDAIFDDHAGALLTGQAVYLTKKSDIRATFESMFSFHPKAYVIQVNDDESVDYDIEIGPMVLKCTGIVGSMEDDKLTNYMVRIRKNDMLTYTFVQPTRILTRPNGVAAIGEVIRSSGYSNVLLIHGKNTEEAGIIAKVKESLEAKKLRYQVFDKVTPDPTAMLVDEAAAMARTCGCDCVLGVGGGSTLDLAKCVNLLRFNEGRCLEYMMKAAVRAPGLFVIPTTAGTGSELSTAAIITEPFSKRKLSVQTAATYPEVAIHDPLLTVSMDPYLTLLTGLDAFSHAVEGYCNNRSNPVNDALCEKVMDLVVNYLPLAVKDGSNLAARSKMQVAASFGGWSLSNAYCNVGHSLAHTIGANYHTVHGAACAYSMPPVLKLLSTAMPEKIQYVGKLLGAGYTGNESPAEIGEKAAAAYREFTANLGLKSVKEENIVVDDLDALAEKVMNEFFARFTPVPVTLDVAKTLLTEMLELA